MITLQELCRYLNDLMQTSLFADYCVNGMQIEGKQQIKRIATGVTASLETVQAAAKLHADVLLVHHGMFWNRDTHVIAGTKRHKIDLLFKHDISLLAYHLPLDAHREFGNNWKAARDMGWTDLEPFIVGGLSIGVKGIFPKVERERFMQKLEEYYKHPAASALGGKEKVSSAALVSGGAYKYITDAVAAGVDCFITGNFDEPVWHQAFEEKINFFAMGHSATERIGPRALGEHLQQKFGLEHHFIDSENPF